MKKLLLVLLMSVCAGSLMAQEVYNSSGKLGGFKRKTVKGYDPDRLIVGGGFNAGFNNGNMNLGIAPIVGYRITNHFSAGVGVGYQYFKSVFFDNLNGSKQLTAHSHLIYPSTWIRQFLYKNIFTDLTLEHAFINQRYPNYDPVYGTYATKRVNYTNTALLLGLGVRQPLGGRVSMIASLFYDLLQGENSPYPRNGIDFRFGIVAGL